MIRQSHFVPLIFIDDLLQELLQKALFSLRLNLRNDHPTVNLKVIRGTISKAFTQWQIGIVNRDLCHWTNHTFDCVSFVLAYELSKFGRIKQWVDVHG